jgi:hypothetical protein
MNYMVKDTAILSLFILPELLGWLNKCSQKTYNMFSMDFDVILGKKQQTCPAERSCDRFLSMEDLHEFSNVRV